MQGIQWWLHMASFGELKNVETEVPKLVEAIRLTTELLVWGEQNDATFIDAFQRHKIFEEFAVALRTDACPQDLKTQVLQAISILGLKLQHPASLDYLLRYLNPCFEDPPELNDEETIAYFATFMKGVAIRLNESNVEHCLVAVEGGQAERMPVLECAVSLVFHEDRMVQTAARTAVLSVLRMEHPRVSTAARDALHLSLLPKLERAAARIVEDIEASKKLVCQWMWGDLVTGPIAEHMPYRWSDIRTLDETLLELRAKDPSRAVITRLRPGMGKQYTAQRHSTAAMACGSLEKLSRAPRDAEDNLLEFVEELLELKVSAITEALSSPQVVLDFDRQTGAITDNSALLAMIAKRFAGSSFFVSG